MINGSRLFDGITLNNKPPLAEFEDERATAYRVGKETNQNQICWQHLGKSTTTTIQLNKIIAESAATTIQLIKIITERNDEIYQINHKLNTCEAEALICKTSKKTNDDIAALLAEYLPKVSHIYKVPWGIHT